jgi:hypothetical protein
VGEEVTIPRLLCKGEELKYLGTTLTHQNSIQEDIENRVKPENNCYHLVQNLLSSSLLFKNTKSKIYRTKISPLFCMGVNMIFHTKGGT